jgi:predicted ATPase
VKRLVVADGIAGREPVGAKASFRAADSERIYAFVEVENATGEDAEITVAFEPPGGGAAKGNVPLAVGSSPRWRTWAFTRAARSAGVWTAVVRAPGGDVLARAPFEITL